jgi:hypothetical protein
VQHHGGTVDGDPLPVRARYPVLALTSCRRIPSKARYYLGRTLGLSLWNTWWILLTLADADLDHRTEPGMWPHAQHWPGRVTVGYLRSPLRFPWLLTLQSMGRACRRRPALLERGRELVLQPGASLLVARHPPHCMQLYIAADANTRFFFYRLEEGGNTYSHPGQHLGP